MNEYENAIEINGITKKYDGFTLDHVSFNVPTGSWTIVNKVDKKREKRS